MTTSPPAISSASDHVLTVDEAAKLLRISRGLAFNAVHTGAIPHLRIGRRILIPRAALHNLIGIPPADESAGLEKGHEAEADDTAVDADTTAIERSMQKADPRELQHLAARLQAIVDSRQPVPGRPRRRTG